MMGTNCMLFEKQITTQITARSDGKSIDNYG